MKPVSRFAGSNGSHGAAGGPVVITGGSGFIGANLADRLLTHGQSVVLFDNLSRPGVEENHRWLQSVHGDLVTLVVGDTRNARSVGDVVRDASAVFHFAAQVAVTTSIEAPAVDFAVNATGTLNLLEALRALPNPPPLIFTSTNKVYGCLEEVELRQRDDRYEPVHPGIRSSGVNEQQRLDFYSPYGCSKGAADQYVLDYARTYQLPALVFRMSCIYGPHQFGTEDQGWVAHFLIQAMEDRAITLFGDGRQVRDILFVEDLVDAFLLAREQIGELQGQAFNIGGGPRNTTSLLELMDLIGELQGSTPRIEWGDWRPGDQRYYVSNFEKFRAATGWEPQTNIRDGVRRLHAWLRASRPAASLAEMA